MKQWLKNKMRGIVFVSKQIVLGVFDALIMVVVGVLGGALLVYLFATPDSKMLLERKIAQTSIIYDRSGQEVLYEIHGEENRKMLGHDQIPEVMRVATIAAEDGAFYHHPGVDPISIGRALLVNVENDGMSQGGSTITQQLARNAFLTREKTIRRKFFEAIIALKIERHFSKEQILDMYLNEVPYGANAYGLETAAETFFGKSASELTLDEAVLLAALPKAPSYLSPYNTHRDELVKRQQQIFQQIKDLELLPVEQIAAAEQENTLAKVKPFVQPIRAPHFVFYVIEKMEEKYGRDFLETGGLKIQTTLDWSIQQDAEAVVREGAARNLARGASNAALVALNPKNGEILAMVGSKDYFDKSIEGEVNVTTRLRQPGSAFKPFAYASAFEKGYEPETLILDAPTNFGPDGSGQPYIPRNYDGKFHGVLSMREALSQSLNVPAVKTLYLAGIDNVINLAERLGITTLTNRKNYGLSLVLGGAEVKPLEMASAFGTFGMDGVHAQTEAFWQITDEKGKVIYTAKPQLKKVLDPQVARRICSILSDNKARTPIFGANSPLAFTDSRVAAKTGTTQEFKDAWTVGFTPSLAVAVWAGNNNSRPMKAGADGVFVAAPIWRAFIDRQLPKLAYEPFMDYQRQASRIAGVAVEKKVTYVNIKTGKEISKEKKAKLNPKKVQEKIEYVPLREVSGANTEGTMSYALPPADDPAAKTWGSLKLVEPKVNMMLPIIR